MGLFSSSKSSSKTTQVITTKDNKVTGGDFSSPIGLSDLYLYNAGIDITTADPFVLQKALDTSNNIFNEALNFVGEGFSSIIKAGDSQLERATQQVEADRAFSEAIIAKEQETSDDKLKALIQFLALGGLAFYYIKQRGGI